jgi:hypothetical protein
MNRKNAFISYSHEDKDFVRELALHLSEQGVPLFFDEWDIKPGDSLVRRIFEEGLAKADLFLIVLSKASVKSKWVREELDAATIRRIEGVTRVVPILKEDCEVPVSLRSLMWVDLRQNVDTGIRKLVNAAYGVTDRPPVGPVPDHVIALAQSAAGLSRPATTLGLFLLSNANYDDGFERMYIGTELSEALNLVPEEVNDAVDELKERGLAYTIDYLGTAPYHFGQVGPTYALHLQFKGSLPYDPETDIKTVAAAVSALGSANGEALTQHTSLSPGRLNRAVKYLEDYGLVRVMKVLGTAPYSFGTVSATRHTRQYVS